MKYFLDFGTHYFHGTIHENGILSFERRGFFGQTQPYEWRVSTFEPSPYAFEANKQHLPSIASRFNRLDAYQAAIADFDGTMEFKWCPGNEAGSNCLKQAIAEVDESGAEIHMVPAIDVKRLVEEIVAEDKEAFIVIKCDIEGAEFSVLPRLLDAKCVRESVKEVFVEWHDRFWADKPNHQEILRKKAIIKESCQESGIVIHDWQ